MSSIVSISLKNIFHKICKNKFEKIAIIFYIFFIFFSGLSLSYVQNAMSYKYASEISIILILMPLVYNLKKNLSFKKTFYLIFILAFLILCIEYIALITHYPYGSFRYNPNLSGQINDILPWTTGFSYLPLLFGATSLSYFFSKKTLYRIILSALILLTLDLVLDPGAVSIGIWSYANKGVYYSVPISNFIGWVITGSLMSMITIKLLKNFPKERLLSLTYGFCISIFLWTWIALLKNLWIPFAIGVFVIIYLLMIYSKYEKSSSLFKA